MIAPIFSHKKLCAPLLKVGMSTPVNSYPQHTLRPDGVHPINIGLHPGRTGCIPSSIWTPVGAVMKGVIRFSKILFA